MIRMFVRHTVTDYAGWRGVYDAFDAQRPGFGVTAHAVYQAADSPNDVTVTHDFDTLDAAKALASSSALREAMQEAGVAGEPTIWFTSPAP